MKTEKNMSLKQKISLFCLAAVITLCGCERMRSWHQQRSDRKNAVAEVDGRYLYEHEVTGMIPQGTSPEDSMRIAEMYIMQWAKNQLVYGTAKRHISDTTDIARRVEQYRRQLIVYTYEQQLVNQRMPKEVTQDEVKNFYDEHSSELLLGEPIMKGRIIVVPQSSVNDSKTSKLLKDHSADGITELHRFAAANAYKYIVSDEDFVPVSQVRRLLPGMPEVNWANPPSGLVRWDSDNMSAIMLISESRATGQVMPLQFAEQEIKNIILNQRKTDFLQDFEQQLLDRAIADGDLVRKHNNQ